MGSLKTRIEWGGKHVLSLKMTWGSQVKQVTTPIDLSEAQDLKTVEKDFDLPKGRWRRTARAPVSLGDEMPKMWGNRGVSS